MGDFLGVILFRTMAEFLGKRILLFFYRITKNEKGIQWLDNYEDDISELSKGCLVSIVGVTALMVILLALAFIFFSN